MPDLTSLFTYLAALVIAITIHEFFHAWIAYGLGDPTAKYMGRLTLNPIAHFDPMGAFMILFMAFSGRGIGWGKPVPVNPNNLRNGPIVGGAMVSVAGPISNILLASLVAIPLRLMAGGVLSGSAIPDAILQFMLILFLVCLSLAIFNLLPIPPLDGFDFWMGILHELPFGFTRQLWTALSSSQIQTYGPFLMLVLIFWGGGLLWKIMTPAIGFLSTLLLGVNLFA